MHFSLFPYTKKDTAPCISAKRGARVSIGFRSVHLFQSLLQVLCDLVRAAGVAEPAQRAVQTCNDVLGLHAGDQLADAFQVAVAAADDLDGRNGVVVVQDKIGLLGAGAFVCKTEFLAHGFKLPLSFL